MEINKIIVSRTDKIGDLVLSIPSFYMVKKLFPNAELIVLVRNYNYDVVKNLPYVDRAIKIDDYSEEELDRNIQEVGAEVFIALYSDKKVTKLAKKSGAKWRIGPYSKLHSYFAYNKGIRQKRSKSVKNEADYNLDLIKVLDPERFEKEFEINTKLYYEEVHRQYAEKFLKEKNIEGKIMVIHPFSGGSAKNLTDIQYMSLIEEILDANKELTVILTASEGDRERALEIVSGVGNERVEAFINQGSLLNLAALIDKGDIYLGTSTGPTHIAGSLQKFIIGIYPIKATQAPLRWGVYGNDKVKYLLPEGKIEEDYSTKEFLSWRPEHIQEIIKYIREGLN